MIFLFHLVDFQRFHVNFQVGVYTSSIVNVTQLPCNFEVSEKIGLVYYIKQNTFATLKKKLGIHVICTSHLSTKSKYCFQDFWKIYHQSLELPPVSLVESDLATERLRPNPFHPSRYQYIQIAMLVVLRASVHPKKSLLRAKS